MFNIQINNISINKTGGAAALIENCFFVIEPGKTYILLGANGSGKTTLALALTGLLNKSIYKVEGSTLYKGYDLLNCDLDKLNEIRRLFIRYVFQDPVHSFNPLKKFGYYLDSLNITETEINEYLNFFLLPSLKTLRNLTPHEVSVGMAQRTALSFAFMAKPKILILDEPNSALDLAASNLLFQKIKEFTSSGGAALIITQDMIFSQKIGDEIYILKDKTVKHLNAITDSRK